MSDTSDGSKRNLGEVAVEHGFMAQAQLDEALQVQHKLQELGVPEDLPTILRKRGFLTEDQLNACRKAMSPKRILAGFEIIEAVGKGAMGAVYKARQISMDRIVALKILPQDLAKDPTFKERFIREARSSGKLDHLNIVHGIDVGEERGITYFAMEFVDGTTIKRRLKKGAIPWEESVRIVLQIADALAYAWKHGIIHRDIKPDNIMIGKDGVAKLCDLGLAKELHAAEESGLTQSGQAVGTPHYISPEQAKGRKDIDTRADIYSLGATLYHMVTGRVPFEETNSTAVMVMHVTDEAPSPRDIKVDIPADLELIIAKAMAKEPKDRYIDPALLAEDLTLVMGEEEPFHAAGFQAKSSIKYVPSTKPPNDPEDVPTAKFSRISGRQGRVTTGPHAPVRPRVGKTGPLAPVGPRDAEIGRSTTKKLEPIKPRSERIKKIEAPAPAADSEVKFSRAQYAEPVVITARSDGAEAANDPVEKSAETPPAPKRSSERKIAAAAPTPTTTPEASAKAPAPSKPHLGWWLGGVAALSIGFYFGFTLTSVDASGTPNAQNIVKPPEPPVVVKVTPEVKTQDPSSSGAVTIKPDVTPETPKELVSRPEPPKRVDTPLPPEPPPPEPISNRPKPETKDPDKPPVEPDQDLERTVAAEFDKVCVSFKHGKYDVVRSVLDGIQEKYRGTQWYGQSRALVDAAYARLGLVGKPWDTCFGAPANPLDGPLGSRWEIIYDQLTFDPNERQEWQLIPGTKVNWRPGQLTLTPSGTESCGQILSLDNQQVERLEADLEPGAGGEYGWALYADLRSPAPIATCWYEADGTIHLWANEVEKTLSLREDTTKATRKMIVQFKGRKAWIDVGGKKEELNLNASPSGRYFPALLAAKAPVKYGTVRVHAEFRAEMPKLMQEEIQRNARLKSEAAKRGLQKIKIVVTCEHPAGVWVNDKRASPDSKGGFQPSTYLFSVPVGSVISVRQFPPQGKDGGPVLLDICPQDGSNKHAGTGITPNIWIASGECGNWMWENRMHAGWQLPDEKLPTDAAAKVPAGARAKYVLAANKSVLLHYVFDPADMK